MTDRPANILPRQLMLLFVGLALAGLPWVAGRTGTLSPAGDPPPAKAAGPGNSLPETPATSESGLSELLPAKDGGRRLSLLCDRNQTVLAAGFRSRRDPPEPSADVAEPRSHGPAPSSPGNVLSLRMVPEDRATLEPGANSRLDETTREMRMSITVVPADAFGNQQAEPSAQPKPDSRPGPGQDDVAGADRDRAPQELALATPDGPRTLSQPAFPSVGHKDGPPSGRLLLPPEASGWRSEQLEHIARQADRQIRRGFELAGRGAYFAARSQFIKALRLVAQGLDAEHQTAVHSRSLAAGLTAVKEADDFIPTGSRLEADLDISSIIDGHRTPVLKNAETENLTPLLALKCYFTFAQEQLAAAAGREVAGSMALHALGKLHGALARHKRNSVQAAGPKAMAFYQAALLVCPQSHMAANDLGVLLARCGHYHDAQTALKHGLSIYRQSTGWHNLAVVYGQLGQAALAQQAHRLSAAARRAEIAHRKAREAPSHQLVRWVDPKTFARSYTGTPAAPRPMPTHPKTTTATKPGQPTRAAQGSITSWLPWSLQEKGK